MQVIGFLLIMQHWWHACGRGLVEIFNLIGHQSQALQLARAQREN